MNDIVRELEQRMRRMEIAIIVMACLAFVAIATAATLLVPDIFKVEYGGTTRFSIDQAGATTINTDTTSSNPALKFETVPTGVGDLGLYARSSDPTAPQQGQIWYNSVENVFKVKVGDFKYPLAFGGPTQTVSDGTANANHGTRGANNGVGSDDPTWTTTAKLGGCALSFDGGDFVALPPDDFLFGTGNSFTIEAWIKRDATGTDQTISRLDLALGGRDLWSFRISSANRTWLTYGDSSGTLMDITSNTTLTDTTFWHHVAAVVDAAADRAYLYIDGTDVNNAQDISSAWLTSSATLYLGSQRGTADFFRGSVDEVAIWNRALTPAEIGARWNGGAGAELAGNESGLISVWHMNDPR